MHYLLLNLPTFTIGAHGLVVGAVLLTIPLNFDCSYVDADLLYVVFIIDTTYSSFIRCGLSTIQWGLALSVVLRDVAGAELPLLLLRSPALGYPLHNLSNGPCIRSGCAALSHRYGSACKTGSCSCNHLHCKKQKTQGVCRDIGPKCVSRIGRRMHQRGVQVRWGRMDLVGWL
jgi:hypothetical protein